MEPEEGIGGGSYGGVLSFPVAGALILFPSHDEVEIGLCVVEATFETSPGREMDRQHSRAFEGMDTVMGTKLRVRGSGLDTFRGGVSTVADSVSFKYTHATRKYLALSVTAY